MYYNIHINMNMYLIGGLNDYPISLYKMYGDEMTILSWGRNDYPFSLCKMYGDELTIHFHYIYNGDEMTPGDEMTFHNLSMGTK